MAKQRKAKLSLIIVFLLLAVLSTGAVYFWQNSQKIKPFSLPTLESSPEAKLPAFKEYQSEEYRFKIAYPQDWKFSVDKSEKAFYLLGISLEKKDPSQKKVLLGPEGEEATYWILFNVEDNPENLSAKEKYLNYFSQESRAEAEKKLEEIIVSGVEGIKYPEPAASASGPSTMVVVSYNGKFYQFTYSAMAHPGSHEKFLSVFEQILENFQFAE